MNIILVGLSGSGKTTTAFHLGKLLNFPVVDLDAYIEHKLNKSIPTLFEEEGELFFRKEESNALKDIFQERKDTFILSLGGGTFTCPENIELCKNNGFSIWLDTNLDIIYNRIKNQTNRPLLNNKNLQNTLYELLEKRKDCYNKVDASYKITEEVSPEQLAIKLIDKFNLKLAQNT